MALGSNASKLAARLMNVCPSQDDRAHVIFAYMEPPLGLIRIVPLVGDDQPDPNIFVGKSAGAVASRVSWTPNDLHPVEQCWSVVAVEPGQPQPALIFVGPYRGDWIVPHTFSLPWMVISTAAGIRASLEHGDPIRLKAVTDERLYKPPGWDDPPPEDEDGFI